MASTHMIKKKKPIMSVEVHRQPDVQWLSEKNPIIFTSVESHLTSEESLDKWLSYRLFSTMSCQPTSLMWKTVLGDRI